MKYGFSPEIMDKVFSLPEQIFVIHDNLMSPKLRYLPRTDTD